MGVEHSGVQEFDDTDNSMLTFRDQDNTQPELSGGRRPHQTADGELRRRCSEHPYRSTEPARRAEQYGTCALGQARENAREQTLLVHQLLPSLATTTVVTVEIRVSAHKHGISDDDIRHAINNAIGSITRPDQPDFTMLIGPDNRSALIEVGILETEDQDYVIHAMYARDRYLKMIDP